MKAAERDSRIHAAERRIATLTSRRTKADEVVRATALTPGPEPMTRRVARAGRTPMLSPHGAR